MLPEGSAAADRAVREGPGDGMQELIEQIGTPSFGRVLRNRRKSLNLTQAELAQLVNMRQATISKVENNPAKCEYDTLYRVCTFLDEQSLATFHG